MQKKAFTLIEMAIVLSIIAIVLGGILTTGKTAYQKQQYESTKSDMKSIKSSLISYASTYGKLPYADTDADGEGDSPDVNGSMPYIDLQVNSTDSYGMKYYYDVNDSLVTSDDSNICSILKTISGLPSVANDSDITKYSVAAIIISSGEDKELTGQNSDATARVYEMAENRYDETTNNDIVVELSAYELLGSICDLTDFNSSN